jgi:hypothetical protein
MKEEIERTLGEDVWDVMEVYWDLPKGSNAKRSYRRSHPEIGEYYDIKNKWDDFINRKVIEIGSMFEPERSVSIRQDTGLTFSQQQFAKDLLSRPSLDDVKAAEWKELVSIDFEHVYNWYFDKVEIPWDPQQRLREIANELDISYDRLLQLIGISLQ